MGGLFPSFAKTASYAEKSGAPWGARASEIVLFATSWAKKKCKAAPFENKNSP